MSKKLIATLPKSSLPRERLIEYGEQALSNQELLAILLRTGSAPYNVMELSGLLLAAFPSLYELKAATLQELQMVRGVGKIRAIELKAMMEFGSRIHQSLQPKYGTVRTSMDLAFQLMEDLKDYKQEHLGCL